MDCGRFANVDIHNRATYNSLDTDGWVNGSAKSYNAYTRIALVFK